MQVMRSTLIILKITGCWQPYSWTSLTKHVLYNIYALLFISVLWSFGLTQFIELVLNVDNPDDFTSIMYTMICVFVAGYKAIDLWINHAKFVALINNLTKGSFKAFTPGEIKILRKFDKMVHNNTMSYTVLIWTSLVAIILAALLTDFRKRQLTFREWIPYDYSSYILFCVTFAYQYLMGISSCFVNVAFDSLLAGVLLHLCCQITILKYRLANITNNQNTLRKCVHHHYDIIQYAGTINAIFSKVIAFQFIASTFIICSSLYQITRIKLNSSHVLLISYMCCVLVQIFIYHWFGNELKLMSLELVDSIFQIEWLTLDNKSKRSLFIIMSRAMKPIEFVSAPILKMNLDSFVALLKTSYSIYNLLVQIQDKV